MGGPDGGLNAGSEDSPGLDRMTSPLWELE